MNAAGRIEDAAQALQLLIERDDPTASKIAQQLEAVNTERRTRTQSTVEEAVEIVLENNFQNENVIVVANPNWHPGIVGIVAGRLVEKFRRPTLVLTTDKKTGMCKGSARSIPNFHFAEAIWAFPDLLTGGGHAMAAGCSLRVEDLDEVRSCLNAFADECLTPEDFIPTLFADVEVKPGELNEATLQEIAHMEPFGNANLTPLFICKSVELNSVKPTKNPIHAQLRMTHAGNPVSGIAFHIGEQFAEIPSGTSLDLLFNAQINEYGGRQSVQWQVKHFRQPV